MQQSTMTMRKHCNYSFKYIRTFSSFPNYFLELESQHSPLHMFLPLKKTCSKIRQVEVKMLSFSNLKKKKKVFKATFVNTLSGWLIRQQKQKIIAKKETTGVKQSNLVWKQIYTNCNIYQSSRQTAQYHSNLPHGQGARHSFHRAQR